jgi:hypothetical protein
MFNPVFLSQLAAQNAQRAAQGAILASQMAAQNAQRAAQAAAQGKAAAPPDAAPDEPAPADPALGVISGVVTCIAVALLLFWLLGGL